MTNEDICAFFKNTTANILANKALREPQRAAYTATLKHFQNSNEPAYVQLPVGCGKTGLIGITPFGLAKGRVLIVTPNVTIKANIMKELDVSSQDCFYIKRGVLSHPISGPFRSELKSGANLHDCDNAHIVVANVQQFSGDTNKWYESLPANYFDVILVDEGHHNVANTWRRLFDYFQNAKVVSYTATPVRSDGQHVAGTRVYRYSYRDAMINGLIAQIEAVHVAPRRLVFTAEGVTHDLSLEDVMGMRDEDWFSRGIALSETCNRSIVQASRDKLNESRSHGLPRQIIAVACSIRHATQVAALYHELGLRSEVLHSNLKQDEKDRIEAALRQGLLDVVVQVQMLGEGYDLPSLSVAAVFRPFRSLSPYVQFVGRILRLADPERPHSASNKVYLVSHVGLNDERWWTDFTQFDQADQQFWNEMLLEPEVEADESGEGRRTLRPFMRVLSEVVDSCIQRGYMNAVDEHMVQEVLDTIRSKGFDPLEFGLSEDAIRQRLELAAAEMRLVPLAQLPVQPQQQRESLRMRVAQDARSIADTVLNRLDLRHQGGDLIKHFPRAGTSNMAILIRLVQAAQNKTMNISSGEREQASAEQFRTALNASADITDQLTSLVRSTLCHETKEEK